MKYFTLAWWEANQKEGTSTADIHRPIEQYKRYYAAVEELLLPRLAELPKVCFLHDATFLSLDLDVQQRTARLRLLLYVRQGNTQEEREGALLYKGVTHCRSIEAMDVNLASRGGHGDLGYDEVEVLGPASYEHRFLFSSGIEYAIRFSDFDYDLSLFASET